MMIQVNQPGACPPKRTLWHGQIFINFNNSEFPEIKPTYFTLNSLTKGGYYHKVYRVMYIEL